MKKDGKILFVNPPLRVPRPFIDYPIFSFNAPLLWASALRSRGFDVSFFDCFLNGEVRNEGESVLLGAGSLEKLCAAGRGCDAVVVAFSSFQRHAGLRSEAISAAVKALAETAREIYLADCDDGSCHYIDYKISDIVKAYPQVNAVVRRGRIPLIKSTIEREILHTAPLSMVDPAHYFDFFSKCRGMDMLKEVEGKGNVFPYLGGLGCPFRCIFCTGAVKRVTALPIGTISRDWNLLKKRGADCVVLLDRYANFNRQRFIGILRLARSLGLKLHFANGLNLGMIDAETACLLRDVCDVLYVSPESGDAQTRRRLGKPFPDRRVEEAFEALSRPGIKTRAHFVIGAPGEGRRSMNRSFRKITDWTERFGIEPFVQPYVPKSRLRAGLKAGRSVYNLFSDFSTKGRFISEARENLLFKIRLKDERKLIVNLSYACNNDCVFCSVGDRPRTDGRFADQVRALRRFAAEGVKMLDLDGGEPLLYPHLFDLLDLAECLGYETITLTTNGRLLGLTSVAERLAAVRGLRLLVSIHGSETGIHDALTRRPGSFSETAAGIRNAVRLGLQPGANVTLTSRNFRDLPRLVSIVGALGVRKVNIQYYTPFGNVDPVLAPPAPASATVRKAVSIAVAAGIEASLVNFVYCFSPDLADRMRNDFFKEARSMLFTNGELVNLAAYLGARRYKIAKCGECPHDLICRGFWRYGDAEIW